jgi:multicomponent Na+:H+ antiporter subunit F
MSWVLYILIVLLVAGLYRLVRGPLLEDRLLALNVIAVLIILIMSYHAIAYGQSFYLDIALVYALLSFGDILAFVKISYIPSIISKDEKREDEE